MSDFVFVLSFFKIAIWLIIVFCFVSKKIFGQKKQNRPENLYSCIAKMGLSSVLIIQVLSMIGALDAVFILASYLSLFFGITWHRNKRKAKYFFILSLKKTRYIVYSFLEILGERKNITFFFKKQTKNLTFPKIQITDYLSVHRALFVMYLFVPVFIQFVLFMEYPFAQSESELNHIRTVKLISSNNMLSLKFNSFGAHSLALLIKSLTLIDLIQVWKMLKIISIAFTVLVLYRSTQLLTSVKGKYLPLFCSSLFGFLVYTDLSGIGVSGEFAPIYLAPIFFLIGLVFVVNSTYKSRVDSWSLVSISSLLVFIHPLAWVVFFVSSSLSSFVIKNTFFEHDRFREKLKYLFLGVVPYAVLSFVYLINNGGEQFILFFNDLFQVSDDKKSMINYFQDYFLISFSALASIAVLMFPSGKTSFRLMRRSHSLSLIYLISWSLLTFSAYGVPNLFREDFLIIVMYPFACLNLSVSVYYLKSLLFSEKLKSLLNYQMASLYSFLVFFLVLLLIFPPKFIHAYPENKMKPTLEVYQMIKENVQLRKWTIVSEEDISIYSLNVGFYMPVNVFLERYTVDDYKWHPKKEKNTIPTSHAFIFVKKSKMRGVASLQSPLNKKMSEWCLQYQKQYKNMSVYFESDELTVYEIHRTVEEEKQVMKALFEKIKQKEL